MSIKENSIAVESKDSIPEKSLEWFYREISPENPLDKPPVLLLHGILSQSFSWCEIMVELANNGFKAIAPDWIGCGYSGKVAPSKFGYTPDAYIEALSSFLEAVKLEKFSLVVQGFLGSVGIQYALRNPQQIEHLIILNTPMSPSVKLPWTMKQCGIPLLGDMITQDPLLVDRTLEGGSGFVISDENLNVYRKPFLQTSATGRALMGIVKNLKLSDSMKEVESGLAKSELPVQIIWGMEDPWLDSESASKLANTNQNIEFTSLKEAKHYPQEHFSQEISPMIINFLRRQNV